jgi:hypothetical protein
MTAPRPARTSHAAGGPASGTQGTQGTHTNAT